MPCRSRNERSTWKPLISWLISAGWKRGPGRAVFDAAAAELGALALIAEDLGVITPAVERLRDGLGYPGMAIVQYHFDPDPHSPHNLANHREHLSRPQIEVDVFYGSSRPESLPHPGYS